MVSSAWSSIARRVADRAGRGTPTSARLFVVMKNGDVLGTRRPGRDDARRVRRTACVPCASPTSSRGVGQQRLRHRAHHLWAAGSSGWLASRRARCSSGTAATIVALGTGLLFVGNLALAPARRQADSRTASRPLHGAAADCATETRAPCDAQRGTDELAEVARAFNEMATRADAAERRLSRRRTAFAGSSSLTSSHELMTPLTSVLGRLETLGMNDLELTIEQRERRRTSAMNEARRLERLIGDLLASVRLESGATPCKLEDGGCRICCDDRVDDTRQECRKPAHHP